MLNIKKILLLFWCSLIIGLILLSSGCSKSSNLVFSGTVQSTLIDVNSEVLGKLIELEKEEGEEVKKRDIIAIVDSSTQEQIVKQYEAVVKSKQARLDDLKTGSRTEQIDQADASVGTSMTAVNSAKNSVDNAQINYDYWLDKYNKEKFLKEFNASTDANVQDLRYKVDTANQQLRIAQDQYNSTQFQLKSAQSMLELLKNGNTLQTIKAAEGDLEQSLAMLEQANLLLSKFKIRSPIDGVFIQKNVDIDDVINLGTSIGTVSDVSELWLKIYLPQKYINLVKLNDEIDLKTSSLPNKVIKGKIVYISNEAEYTPKNTETNESKENTVFEIKIKLLDNLYNIKPGMTMDAIIPPGGR